MYEFFQPEVSDEQKPTDDDAKIAAYRISLEKQKTNVSQRILLIKELKEKLENISVSQPNEENLPLQLWEQWDKDSGYSAELTFNTVIPDS
ncbi:MAG: hypothetical protein HKM04_00140 [Legionellales bacterium]|nr:hypothetical protein [Legionellales bacterium]